MVDFSNDFTDTLISILEPEVQEKYSLSLIKLLTNPGSIIDTVNINEKITNIKTDVNNYISNLLSKSSEKQLELDKTMDNINNLSIQLEQLINLESNQKQLPILTSIFEHNEKQDQTIYLEKFGDNEQLLVKKFIDSSIFIINMSEVYNHYKIGHWVFSGNKNYKIKVHVPENELLIIESTKIEINDLLNQSLSFFSLQLPKTSF